MNKRLKLITAFLLMLTMVVTSSSVFAGTDPQPADGDAQGIVEVTEEALPEDGEVIEEGNVSDIMLMSEEGTQLEVAEGDEGVAEVDIMEADNSLNAKTINYTTTTFPEPETYSYQKPASGECVIIPLNVTTSGKLWFAAQGLATNSANATVFVGKYDPATGEVDYRFTKIATLVPGDDPIDGIGGLDVTAGGSYVIGIESDRAGMIDVAAYVVPYATRTILPDKWMVATGYKFDPTAGYNKRIGVLFRIKPTKTGYIRVYDNELNASYKSAGYFTLLNSKKKVVSDKLYYYEGDKYSYIAFGVKKGATYYLRANDFGDFNDQYVFGVKYKIYSATLRANTSKKKATNMKRKAKYITTAVPADGKSGSNWYKFKMTKKRTTQIRIDATYMKSGKTSYTLYKGKKKITSSSVPNGKIRVITLKGYKKGTYYVKVSTSARANGMIRTRYVK